LLGGKGLLLLMDRLERLGRHCIYRRETVPCHSIYIPLRRGNIRFTPRRNQEEKEDETGQPESNSQKHLTLQGQAKRNGMTVTGYRIPKIIPI
jgi:hypothetical protein